MIPGTSLSNGIEIPLIGLGTTHSGGYYHEAVLNAINKCGYRLIDTAKRYGVEKQLGIAFRASNVDREDLFICTKLWPVDCGNGVAEAFQRSCEKLDTDYVDLYMIHMPHLPSWIQNRKETREETWRQMELLYDEDHVRSIGVSNYSIEDLDSMMDYASVLPHVNQVEFHPWYHQQDLKIYCDDHSILTMGYCPLAKGKYLDDPILIEMSKKYGKSPAQICLRWSTQQNVPAVPKSTDFRRLMENTQIFDFELSDDDVYQLSSLSSDDHKIVDLSSIDEKMTLPDGYKLKGRVFGVPGDENSTKSHHCAEQNSSQKSLKLSVCI